LANSDVFEPCFVGELVDDLGGERWEVVRDERGVLFALMEARRASIKENARIIVLVKICS